MNLEEIEQHTLQEKILQQVTQSLKSNHWDKQFKPYFTIRDQLSLHNNILKRKSNHYTININKQNITNSSSTTSRDIKNQSPFKNKSLLASNESGRRKSYPPLPYLSSNNTPSTTY